MARHLCPYFISKQSVVLNLREKLTSRCALYGRRLKADHTGDIWGGALRTPAGRLRDETRGAASLGAKSDRAAPAITASSSNTCSSISSKACVRIENATRTPRT